MKASNVKLSDATSKAISDWAKVGVREAKSKVKAVDGLMADGVTPDMLKSPKEGESHTLYNTLKASVVLGFDAPVQALLSKDTKSLSEGQKKTKRYWQQQIGSKLKDLRLSLITRLKNADGDSDGAEDNKSSWEATKRKVIAEIIAQAQKKEASKINNIASFIKDLESALARIPANA
jgi:hypothetical protein